MPSMCSPAAGETDAPSCPAPMSRRPVPAAAFAPARASTWLASTLRPTNHSANRSMKAAPAASARKAGAEDCGKASCAAP